MTTHTLSTVLATLVALGALAHESRAGARCESYEPYTITDHDDSDRCPPDWSCLELVRDRASEQDPIATTFEFAGGCNPIGVEFLIRESDVTLDCRGGTLKSYPSLYPRQLWEFLPRWETFAVVIRAGRVRFPEGYETASCADMDVPSGAPACESGDAIQNTKVIDCNIEGYTRGAVIRHESGWNQAVEDRIAREYLDHFRHPNERECRVTQVEDCLRAGAPRDIEFDRVHIRNSEGIGLYVGSYVQRLHFHHGSVRDTNGSSPGAYLSFGSRDNTIAYSTFASNGREGLAIDGSSDNFIHHNWFEGNGKVWWSGPWTDRDDLYGAAVTVFRNGWEGAERDNPSPPRAQHASGNRINNNEIVDHRVGVWIAYRQDDGPPSHRSDPVYYAGDDSYFRPHAENTTVNFNDFSHTLRSIVIDDDAATVLGNRIYFPPAPPPTGAVSPVVPAAVGIELGSWVRRRVGDPVHQSIINGNVFYDRVVDWQTPIEVTDCAFDNAIEENLLFRDGSYDAVGPDVGSCDRARTRIRFHKTNADGSYRQASGHQQAGAFGSASHWLAGDFDADGIDDLLHAYISDDDQLRMWLHTGTGEELEYRSSFQTFPAQPTAVFDANTHWLVGNFDGVRGDDLAIANTDDNSTASYILTRYSEGTGFSGANGGTGMPSWATVEDRPATATEWRVADVDGDGTDELVLAYRTPAGDARVEVYAADANLVFRRRSAQTIAVWLEGQRWVVGDWNDDGRDDLMTVFPLGASGAMAAVHLATATGFEPFSWQQYVRDSGGEAALSERDRWLATDFDGDGDDDLVRVYPVGATARAARYRSDGVNLGFVSSHTLGDFHDEQVWLAGDFDCGARQELVVVDGQGDFGAYAPMADAGSARVCDPNADAPAPTPPTWSGNPADDIVWQSSEGQMHYWRVRDGHNTGGFDISAAVHSAWVPRAVGDLNGDGHEDIVFRQNNGQVHWWLMRNGVRQGGYDIYSPVSSAWTVRGAGDVNGDGHDDIIWQNSSGQVHYWSMRNGVRLGGADIYAPVSSAWSLRGVGDVDGDGTDDIVWQNSSGQVHYWPMRNGVRQSGHDIFVPVSSVWSLRDVGDVNGDGTDDIVWQRSSGQVHYWSMRNGQRTSSADMSVPVSGSWTLVGVGNVDGN